jgi:RecQ-mediated genome instability protein 1
MHHGTGLPEVSSFTGNISGPPVLVQIMAIKEIGISAFQLEQIRAAREERILAGVGDEEGEEDGDPEVEGEGPMPKYPRGTLLLRLSDGATEFDGMEYRPIPQVVLGVTKLGYKVISILPFFF